AITTATRAPPYRSPARCSPPTLSFPASSRKRAPVSADDVAAASHRRGGQRGEGARTRRLGLGAAAVCAGIPAARTPRVLDRPAGARHAGPAGRPAGPVAARRVVPLAGLTFRPRRLLRVARPRGDRDDRASTRGRDPGGPGVGSAAQRIRRPEGCG